MNIKIVHQLSKEFKRLLTTRLNLAKRSAQLCLLLLLSLLLSACGGGGSDNNSTGQGPAQPTTTTPPSPDPTPDPTPEPEPNPEPTPDPDTPTPEPTPDPTPTPIVVAFDFQQQSNNLQYRGNQVQSEAFANATGGFRLPLANQNLTGNLTISVDLTDPDGINGVFVGFEGAADALQLCPSACGTDYHRTITGVNPQDFGINSGTPRLELWVDDGSGNRTLVNTVDFSWQVTPVTGVSANRTSSNIALGWNAIGGYLRYNVYIASQAGVTHKNYQTLPDGQAFLALRDPQLPITGREDAKVFFSAVTGVDGSGESAFSEGLKIAALDGVDDQPPTAVNDSFTTNEDTTLTGNLIANDSDIESSTLTVTTTPTLSPSNGQLTISSNGTFSYTPTADFSGSDMFSYQVADGIGQTAVALVEITILAANDPPESLLNNFNVVDGVARDPLLFETALARGTLTVVAPGLLINDLDIDGNGLSIVTTPVIPPTRGTLQLNSDGSFTYTNNADATTGEDTFTYQSTDGQGAFSQATVRITINGSSFPPVAANDTYQLQQDDTFVADGSSTNTLSILANDTDLDAGDTLTITTTLIRPVAHGTLNMGTNGLFTYIPTSGFFGVDYFVYEITDAQGNTARAAGIFQVGRKNTAPVTVADTYTLDEDTTLSVGAAGGVLANDSDAEGDAFAVDLTVLLNPTNGQLTMANDGGFDYVPTANFAGSDSFQYQVTDSLGAASVETVTLTITNVNDVPVANDDFAQTFTDTPVVIDLLLNDTDVENQPLTITSAIPTGGTINGLTNPITYTPASGFEGDIEIDYIISDGAATAAAKVFVSINNVNQAPTAVNDSYTLDEDQLFTNGTLLTANDSDSNGDPLTVNTTPIQDVSNGTLNLSTDGSFSYQANANFNGSDTFRYQINDGQGGTAIGDVALTINPVNDNPVANNDNAATTEETLVNIAVLTNDSDVENDTLTVDNNATAANGTATVNTNNTIDYFPNTNFFGSDTLNYSISDGNGGSDSATVTITVQNANDDPVAVDDVATTTENISVVINVLANDSDIDGDTLQVLSANASNGSVDSSNGINLTYTPNLNFSGTDVINYIVSDQNGGTASAFVTVTVNNINDAPVAVNDISSTNEDTPVDINVLDNDSDIDGDALSIDSMSATNGSLSVNANNTLHYAPNANFNGSDNIAYTISDTQGLTASANVAVTILSVNDAPIALDDIASTNEDTPVTVAVLSNDSDIDSALLSLSTAVSPNGSIDTTGNVFVYTPNANFNGVDSITYNIIDNDGGSASATVVMTVNAINDLPTAVADIADTNEDQAVAIDVLANDTDPDGDALTISEMSATNGSLAVNVNNTLQYTPNSQFNGEDTINYTIDDGNGGTASSSVLVTVAPVNDQPVAVNDIASTQEDTLVNIDVLGNDTDLDGDSLTVSAFSASNGSIVVAANNTLNYTPNADFNGTDTINYTADDSNGGTASAEVTVTISAVNDDPVAVDDTADVNEDNTANINVLNNDSDIDGDTLSVSSPLATNGAVSVNADQTLNYAPAANFNGQDSITYQLSDNNGGSAEGTVTVSIAAVNDDPVAQSDSAIVLEDNSTNINVLFNDSDIDGDPLRVSAANASSGSVITETDNSLTYTPNSNFNGSDTINYTVTDDVGNGVSSFVAVTITAVNDIPVAFPDITTVPEDGSITINVLANDVDADGANTLTLQTEPTATNGTVSVVANQLVYTPNANFNGADTINYSIIDDANITASSTVAVTVSSVEDTPVAVADSISLDEDATAVTIDVLSNDTDDDGQTLTINAATATNGTATFGDGSSISYTPNANFNGTDTINYTIEDTTGLTASASVAVTVNSVEDTPIAVNDTITANEDTSINIPVLDNDSDGDGDLITITAAVATSSASVTINSLTSLDYVPVANFHGTDTINYTIEDANSNTATASVTVTVDPVNDLPVPVADTASTNEDVAVNIAVLDNDSDIDGDTLTVKNPAASNGTLLIVANTTLDYFPNANFNGTDTITYDADDGNGGVVSSSVTVTVAAVNDNPTPLSDTATTTEDDRTPVSISVLSNDTDIDGDTLSVDSASAINGTIATPIANNVLDYTPNADFHGVDTITYQISDGNGGTASATVAVTVTGVNDSPVAVADAISSPEDNRLIVDVLANDSDIDGDTLTVTDAVLDPPTGSGTLSIRSDFSLDYLPNIDFNGDINFNYTISDGNGGSASSTGVITITAVNDAPVANPDTASTNEDTLANINILSNDSDTDGDVLTVKTAVATSGSSVSIESDGSLNYTPNANLNGSDTINYTIEDPSNVTASSAVTVTIVAVNDNPTAVADTASVAEDGNVNIDVLANDSDIDGDTLSVDNASSAPTASNGSVVVETNNTLTYTPASNFFGSDTIAYYINDGQGGTASSTVTVTVTATNDNPVAVADSATTAEDTLVNIDILANDSDPDGGTLTVDVATATSGAITIKPDKTLDYVPITNFNGSDTINYTISNASGSASSSVGVNVTAVNDAPTISSVSASITENSANTTAVVTVTGSDVDTGDTLTYSIVANSANIFGINSGSGELNIADNSSLNFEAASSHTVTVKVQDAGGLNNTADATITVTNVAEVQTPTIDTAFGVSGTASSNAFATEQFDRPRASVIDGNGKLVIVGKNSFSGSSADIFIARFNTDGTLDRSFGKSGVTNQDLGAEEEAVAVAIDSANRIVITGNRTSGSTTLVFTARFSSQGVLDTTFNSGLGFHTYGEIAVNATATDAVLDASDNIIIAAGNVNGEFNIIKFSADGTTHVDTTVNFFSGSDFATTVVLQSDGKALLIGFVNDSSNSNDFGVARFDISTTPVLDTTYDGDGKATFDFGAGTSDLPHAAHINSSDEIVITGSTIPSGGTKTDMAALKIDNTGALVTDFGSSGKLIVDIDGDGSATTNASVAMSIAADSTGNLYFGVDKGLSNVDNVIYKTDALGAPITAYGTSAEVSFDHNSSANNIYDLQIDSSDRAVMLSTTVTNVEEDVLVARFTTAGVLDTSFSADGFNTLDPTYSVDTMGELIELTVAPHTGKFAAVGTAGAGNGSKLIVVRYNADGTVDETFGINGYYLHTGVEATITGTDIIEQSDGKLVAVGSFDADGLAVRLLNTGGLDTTFDTNGSKILNCAPASMGLNAIAIDRNNKLVVAGTSTNGGGNIYMARLNADGSFDTSVDSDPGLSFNGANGFTDLDLGTNEAIYDIATLTDGSTIAVGQKGSNALVVKFLEDGNLDTASFSPSDGYVSVDLDPGNGGNTDTLKRVKIKTDGKIVAAGYSSISGPNNILIQLSSNGSLDTGFDTDGIVSHNYGSGNSVTFGLTLDASENILITGYNSNGSNDDIFVARVDAAGAKDPLFNGAAGGILFDYAGTESATAILARADGTIVIAGSDDLNLFPTSFFFVQKLKLVEP